MPQAFCQAHDGAVGTRVGDCTRDDHGFDDLSGWAWAVLWACRCRVQRAACATWVGCGDGCSDCKGWLFWAAVLESLFGMAVSDWRIWMAVSGGCISCLLRHVYVLRWMSQCGTCHCGWPLPAAPLAHLKTPGQE